MSKKLKLFKPALFAAVLILITGAILLSGGCSKKEQKLNLYAAAGLKKPMDNVISAFQKETGIEVIPNYGHLEDYIPRSKKVNLVIYSFQRIGCILTSSTLTVR